MDLIEKEFGKRAIIRGGDLSFSTIRCHRGHTQMQRTWTEHTWLYLSEYLKYSKGE